MSQTNKKPRKFKSWRVIYFTGNFFSSGGEQMHTAIIRAKTEEEAEMIFTRTFGRGKHLAMIEEVSKKSKLNEESEE